MLQVKAYTKGEHVLRIEATVHNARELRCRRSLDNFPEIITRLAGIAERFTTLDCADISFLPDGVLDQLPLPSRIGAVRAGGIDLNKPRIRAALTAALALAPAPHGFTVADFAARVCQLTRQDGYTIRQAAYDLRKLRGKHLIDKPVGPAATTSHRRQPAPSPDCSPSATTSSRRSLPASAAPAPGASPHTGPPSTATTRPSAQECRPSSTTSASTRSQPRHRQHFVDGRSASS
jgi:hypothetical protein